MKGREAISHSGDEAAKKLKLEPRWSPMALALCLLPPGLWCLQSSTHPGTISVPPQSPCTAEQLLPRREHNLSLSASDRSSACEKRLTSKKYRLTYCSMHYQIVIGTRGTYLARKPVMRQHPTVTTKALLSENQRQQA